MPRKSKYLKLPEKRVSVAVRYIAGIYLRLSVEDGDDLENNSIGNQRKICLDFLSTRSDVEIGRVYVDNGHTGMNYKRPGFQDMFSDLEAGTINCVIVKDISRLGRHYILTSEYVEKIFPKLGIRLICVNDNFDSADPCSDRDSLLMPFKLIINDTYVKDISKKIQSSIEAKMCSGEYLPSASSIPYGYFRSPECGTYIIDTETAPIVRRIFELRMNGTAFNAIAKLLNAEGIPSPGKLRYDRGITKAAKYQNTLWVRGTIRKITNDPVYLGNRIHGKVKRDRLGGDKIRRPKENWQIIPNAHPAIISQEIFDKVQEVNQADLTKRAAFTHRAAPERDFRAVFHNKLFCGNCGAKMTAGKWISRESRPELNSFYFNCNQYRNSNHQRCSNHYVRQEVLIDTLKHFLDKQVEIAVDVEQLVSEVRRTGAVTGTMQASLTSLHAKRIHLEAKRERLLEDVADGLLDREEYLRVKAIYTEESAQLERQEETARQQYEKMQSALATADTWLKTIRNYQAIPVIDRGLVDSLVEKILVYQDRSVRICLTYGDPIVLLAPYAGHENGEERRAG